jgi:cytochrome c
VKSLTGVALLMLMTNGDAVAQERPQRLRDLPPRQRVEAVTYCRGTYEVALGDGQVRRFREYDLAFKIDASPHGPEAARPALVPTGRVGDRAFIVFAALDELRTALRETCRN